MVSYMVTFTLAAVLEWPTEEARKQRSADFIPSELDLGSQR